ncbi:MAG: sulfur carrier protein ThiS [Flavobacteriales bacterium]|nr:sulfur carrier protein ThiS [Flavobacteriales bacterium]MCB9335708.1 sulfur carrier protein ThiS [Flavobacteriales bacterium]
MDVTLNNNTIQINESTTVEQLIMEQNISSKGIAIALNNQVISKNDWQKTELKENDNIIIITATQGG